MAKEQTVEGQIIKAMSAMRERGISPVHPKFVAAWLDAGRGERSLRERMAEMAKQGILVRVSERGGYALPSPLAVVETEMSEEAVFMSSDEKRALLWKWIEEKDPRAGWSQRRLASHLGVGKSTIGRWQREYLASGPFGPVGLKVVRRGVDGRLYDVRGIIRANRARMAEGMATA